MKLGVPDLVTNSYFPAIAAVELGFFANEGLDVDIELSYPQTMDALRDGEIELAADCAHATLEAFPNWRGAKLLMALSQEMYWLLIMRTDLNIEPGDLQALKGRRIGAGPGVDLVLHHLLREGGVDPEREEIHIAAVPGGDAPGASFGVTAAKALEMGSIDGFWANGMGAQTAVRAGVGSVVLDVRRGIGPPKARHYTFSALVSSDKLIRDNPESITAAVRAVCRAQRALCAKPELAAKVGAQLFPSPQREMIADIVKGDVAFYDAVITEAAVQGVNAFANAAGLLEAEVPYDEVVASGLMSIWESGE